MQQPQEIILYRNPIEYQLYNTDVMVAVPIVCALAVFLAVFITAAKIHEAAQKRQRRYSTFRQPIWAFALSGGIAALATLYYMI